MFGLYLRPIVFNLFFIHDLGFFFHTSTRICGIFKQHYIKSPLDATDAIFSLKYSKKYVLVVVNKKIQGDNLRIYGIGVFNSLLVNIERSMKVLKPIIFQLNFCYYTSTTNHQGYIMYTILRLLSFTSRFFNINGYKSCLNTFFYVCTYTHVIN